MKACGNDRLSDSNNRAALFSFSRSSAQTPVNYSMFPPVTSRVCPVTSARFVKCVRKWRKHE